VSGVHVHIRRRNRRRVGGGERRGRRRRRRRIARPCLGCIFPNHQELAVPLLPVPLQRLARRLDVVAQAGIESKVRSGLIVF